MRQASSAAGSAGVDDGLSARAAFGRTRSGPPRQRRKRARAVLEKTSVSPPDEIDLPTALRGVRRDRLEPATAAYVHGLWGCVAGVQIADVIECLPGFLNGIVLAASMWRPGGIRSALLVSGEKKRSTLLERTLQTSHARRAGDHAQDPSQTVFRQPHNIGSGCGGGGGDVDHALKSDQPRDGVEGREVVRTDSSAKRLVVRVTLLGSDLWK